jgi:hypothetical protein
MCERASFIAIRGGKIAWLLGNDSHSEIVKAENLKDLEVCDRRFIKIECDARDDPFSTNPNDWTVKEDEKELPAWYDHEEWAPKILDELTLRRIPEERRTGVVGKLIIREGQHLDLPWLRQTADLRLDEGASLTAPVLAQTASLYLDEGASLTAPVLAQTADLRLYKGASLTAPVLAQTADLRLYEGASLDAPLLKKKKR